MARPPHASAHPSARAGPDRGGFAQRKGPTAPTGRPARMMARQGPALNLVVQPSGGGLCYAVVSGTVASGSHVPAFGGWTGDWGSLSDGTSARRLARRLAPGMLSASMLAAKPSTLPVRVMRAIGVGLAPKVSL